MNLTFYLLYSYRHQLLPISIFSAVKYPIGNTAAKIIHFGKKAPPIAKKIHGFLPTLNTALSQHFGKLILIQSVLFFQKEFFGIFYLAKKKSFCRNARPCLAAVFAFHYLNKFFHCYLTPSHCKQCTDHRSDHISQKSVCPDCEYKFSVFLFPKSIGQCTYIIIDLGVQFAERGEVFATNQQCGCLV